MSKVSDGTEETHWISVIVAACVVPAVIAAGYAWSSFRTTLLYVIFGVFFEYCSTLAFYTPAILVPVYRKYSIYIELIIRLFYRYDRSQIFCRAGKCLCRHARQEWRGLLWLLGLGHG